MSRHAQLPPRCPLQKKTLAPQVNAPISLSSGEGIEFHSRQNERYKTTSESFIFEDQPPWLNDLLSDLDLDLNTDSSLPDLDQLNEKEIMESGGPNDELGSSCMYGPNSPRRRNMLGFPENEIASAFSEYAVQNPLLHLDGYNSVSGVQSDSYRDARVSADEISSEIKQMRCHPGQRSRARKLQYISELEGSANVLQNIGSQLAVRVASLIQQHAALSLENTSLKQQLLRVNRKKFIVDNEYETLKIELERLRSISTATNKFHSMSRPYPVDMRKLNRN
ncbi:hypothetical protein AAHA92_17759 [Salvia divinorum]|uniref:Uncharacterized protein n=1 Tax=Salvia divinorum TaxID=28513 RepID=A0ABD1GZU1_SALDI